MKDTFIAGMCLIALLQSQNSLGGEKEPSFFEATTVYARPLTSASASVTVIDRRMIEESGARTVGELLQHAPGIYMATSGARGALGAAQIRGGDPNFTLVLIDGVSVNDSTDQLGGAFDLDSLSTVDIERIELVAGPISYFYGSAGLSGVVSIVTRRGEKDVTGARIEGEGGDASLRHAAAAVSGKIRDGGYRVGLVSDQEAGRIGRDRFKGVGLVASAGARLGGSSEWRLSTRIAGYDAADYPEASGGPLLGTGDVRDSTHNEASVHGELLIGRKDRAQHKLDVALYEHVLDRSSPGVGPLVPPSVEKTDFLRTAIGWTVTRFTRRQLSLSAGAQVNREDGRNRSALLLDPEVPGDYDMSRTSAAVYGEALGERGGLTFEGASRVDFPERFPAQWSPRCGLSYRLAGGTTRLRATLGRAFKLPSFFALASPPALGGNPELKPERSTGGDLGVEREFKALRLHALLSVFYTRYEDLIDFDFDTFSLVNRAEVGARGAELSAVWRPVSPVALEANVTFNDVRDLTSRELLRQRPRWVGGAILRWNPHPNVALWLDHQVISRRIDHQLPAPDVDTVGGYQVTSVSLSWRFADKWQIYGRIDNLTDEDYETSIGFPGAGRSARLGMRYSL